MARELLDGISPDVVEQIMIPSGTFEVCIERSLGRGGFGIQTERTKKNYLRYDIPAGALAEATDKDLLLLKGMGTKRLEIVKETLQKIASR